jgi:hypothetical protein
MNLWLFLINLFCACRHLFTWVGDVQQAGSRSRQLGSPLEKTVPLGSQTCNIPSWRGFAVPALVLWIPSLAALWNLPLHTCHNKVTITVQQRVWITRGYGLDGLGAGVWVPVGTGSTAHPASYPMGTGDSFLWGVTAEAWSLPLIFN